MTKLEKYNSYKNSGVEWLGDIPEHWEVQKLKFNAKIETGNSISDSKKGNYENIEIESYPYISTKDINYEFSTIDYDNGLKIPTTNKDFKIASPETTLICIEGGSAGKKIAYNTQSICYVNKLASLQSINNNPKYIYYLTKSNPFKIQFELSMNGLIGGVSISIMKNFELLFPPFKEQEKIANYLDKKTAQIDEAISQKQKLIELLKERKQIVINDAVTSGLDKNAEMIDSGIEWIGQIPKHWKIEKLKSYCKAYGRIGFRGYTISDLVNENDGAITISPSNIFEYSMKFEKCSFLSWEKYYESPEIQIEENDILIVKTGSTFGKVGMVKNLPKKATINPQLLVLKNIKIERTFFYYMLISTIIQTQINKYVIGSTIPTISENKILNFISLLPPKEEQIEIVEYIDNQISKIDIAIELEQNYIEKLKEYKATLIDSVVTGKVRVL